MTMPNHLRHAQHVGKPHPDCAVCQSKAKQHGDVAGVPVKSAGTETVRAVGGFVQTSGRFVGT